MRNDDMCDRLPPQCAPVQRPDVFNPHICVDIEHGSLSDVVAVRMRLLHGANYNDHAAWSPQSFADRGVRR